ncbi:serine/threonine-protein kinase-like protein At5g23170 [Vigna umbellata]|uniref:serine/threonine-protein kinase-like protein At5g23170 n=1 Tax=Vigna umbellata TaxID=87088 RepID=UPI001F5EB284|nr:serine/threonine-protein kinase-like protein At5g23170 [Vigna umbellata]
MEEFEYEEVVKATENFNPRRVVGKGSHGMVYKGFVRFKENNSFRLVAVKKPSQGLQSLHDNSKLENEIRVLSSLPENPHVVNLLGTTSGDDHGHKLIVMDFMPNASLHDLLHANENPPTWPKRVQIAMQIARAVQFLHQGKPVVIHRDIKPSNILFDSRWNAKLADFGLAVRGVDPMSRPAGTMGYLDPCYTTPDKLSTKNDIFSFGVVLMEIISGRKAIDACKTPASVVEWAVQLMDEQVFKEICDARVALPGYMVETITRLLRYASRCVSENEDERPSAGEIVMGMESWLAKRVRFPVWRRVLNGLVWLRKKPMISIGWQTQTRIQCIAEEESVVEDAGVAGGKISITIREVLADVNIGVTQIQMS